VLYIILKKLRTVYPMLYKPVLQNSKNTLDFNLKI